MLQNIKVWCGVCVVYLQYFIFLLLRVVVFVVVFFPVNVERNEHNQTEQQEQQKEVK